ncbi:threonine aldolase family protein [Cumulibacter soli]|uniref:threonine aldolase family protein n=1 Tax=Cumulibacter soli TaxID=2546344 RepID=UPI001ABADEAC|nr:beta-eliminating lyase-related protein [Cumulibacter soli]
MIPGVMDNSGIALLSDNAAGVHPRVMTALATANDGYAAAYGADSVTSQAIELLQAEFGNRAQVALTTTGTAANVLGLRAVTDSFNAVICAQSAHLHRDECGAPEHFCGCTLLTVPATDGKIGVDDLDGVLADHQMVHRVQPRVVSISQCTEWGTVYSPDQLDALARWCHANDVLLHVDGARLANAAAALGCSLADAASGADLISFGCSKNGAMNAESVILASDAARTSALGFHQKQAMQLTSKMRFVAAQVVAMLTGELWLRNARHANAMASRLADGVRAVRGVRLAVGQVTNSVYAHLPDAVLDRISAEVSIHIWDRQSGVIRLMTSYATTPQDVDRFIADLTAAART